MNLQFDPSWLAGFVEAEAQARGQGDRLRALAANRESDGLDSVEATVDAADSLGLVEEVRSLLAEQLDAVPELEAVPLRVDDLHGGMPTWRRTDEGALLQLPMDNLAELRTTVERLFALIAADPERVSAVVPVGLGGTGGCACGDELPEDAPPGPLFDRPL